MQHISSNILPAKQGRGGRISSPKLRETIDRSQDFCGLEEGVKPFDLLTLAKRAGKGAGFSSKMIRLLDHYMMFTREIDWREGGQPIVYQSQYKTAMDLDMSERHLQRLEKQLFDAGAITWNDSGNCKRFGQRCPESGKILYAYGVDLTPLAYLKPKLQEVIQEQELYKAAKLETKRQVSGYRAKIKSLLAEMDELDRDGPAAAKAMAAGQGAFIASYDEIAVPYRTTMSLEMLRSMLGRHQELYNQILGSIETFYKTRKIVKESPKTDSFVPHIQDTKQNLFNKLNTSRDKSHCLQGMRNENPVEELRPSEQGDSPAGAEGKARASQLDPSRFQTRAQKTGQGATKEEKPENPVLKTGLQHLSAKQLLNAASPRFKEHIPMCSRAVNFEDIVEAAYALRPKLHISQKSWARACQVLTKYGAAICLLLVDQAMHRTENPVRKPAAYFNAMIGRARAGELFLHKSIFGLLKRFDEESAANSDTDSSSQERA